MSNIYWLISQKEPMSVAGPVGQMWVWITERGDIKASWHPEASGSTARFDVMFNEWSKLWTSSMFDSVRGLSDHIYEPKNSQIATSYNWRYFTQLFFFFQHIGVLPASMSVFGNQILWFSCPLIPWCSILWFQCFLHWSTLLLLVLGVNFNNYSE